MRKPGEEGAPSAKDFRDSEKTAKKEKQNKIVYLLTGIQNQLKEIGMDLVCTQTFQMIY